MRHRLTCYHPYADWKPGQ